MLIYFLYANAFKVVDGLNTGPKSHSEMFAVRADLLFTKKNPDTHFSLRNHQFGIYVLIS